MLWIPQCQSQETPRIVHLKVETVFDLNIDDILKYLTVIEPIGLYQKFNCKYVSIALIKKKVNSGKSLLSLINRKLDFLMGNLKYLGSINTPGALKL